MTSYRSAVLEARRIVRRTEEDQWRLAELTWEQVTQRGYMVSDWAKDVGISRQYAGRLVPAWERVRNLERKQWPHFSDLFNELSGSPINSVAALRRQTAQRKADVVRDLRRDDPELDRLLREEEEIEQQVHDGTSHELADQADNAAASSRRTLSATDEATDYLRGAARELAHAFAARQREGIEDSKAEQVAIEEVTRALSMYVAEANGTTAVTDADRFWLSEIGVRS